MTEETRNLPAILETRFQMVESRLTLQTTMLERIDGRMDKYDALIQAMATQGATIAATLQAVLEQTKQHGDEMKEIKRDQVSTGTLLARHEERMSGSKETRNVVIATLIAIGSAVAGHFIR